MVWIALELAPQPAHQHVDAALEGASAAPLREIEQLIAREDAPGPFTERLQQVELGPGDDNARAIGAFEVAQRAIDAPAEKCEDACIRGARRDHGARRATQHRLDAGKK